MIIIVPSGLVIYEFTEHYIYPLCINWLRVMFGFFRMYTKKHEKLFSRKKSLFFISACFYHINSGLVYTGRFCG